ncbi:MAG: SdpI family protein [Firmicutes bacterium]|nr:SdpI family protein [Bacillota bacterium]
MTSGEQIMFSIIMYGTIAFVAALILIMAPVLKRCAGAKPNRFVGFRTRRAMSSQEAWTFTHLYASRLFFIAGVITVLMSVPVVILTVILWNITGVMSDEFAIIFLACFIGVQMIPMLAAMIRTLVVLHRTFDKNGERIN